MRGCKNRKITTWKSGWVTADAQVASTSTKRFTKEQKEAWKSMTPEEKKTAKAEWKAAKKAAKEEKKKDKKDKKDSSSSSSTSSDSTSSSDSDEAEE